MKKLRFYSVVFTFALLIIPMLQSCLNDDDEGKRAVHPAAKEH